MPPSPREEFCHICIAVRKRRRRRGGGGEEVTCRKVSG
jgi:hypothetical protein